MHNFRCQTRKGRFTEGYENLVSTFNDDTTQLFIKTVSEILRVVKYKTLNPENTSSRLQVKRGREANIIATILRTQGI